MEARTLLERIRQRGFTIKAVGGAISLAPKQLINDRMITFVREHKEALLTALYQEKDVQKAIHRERKLALPKDLLHISRALLRRFLNDAKCRDMTNYKGSPIINDKVVETYLDDELINFDYEIEAMIKMYRVYTPSSASKCKCVYQPPFCSCGGILVYKPV